MSMKVLRNRLRIRISSAVTFVSRIEIVWTFSILLVFLLFREILGLAAGLGEEEYFERSFLLASFRNGLPLLGVLIGVSSFLGFRKRLGDIWRKWSDCSHGRELSRFTFVIVAILAWNYSLYDYNLFYDRGHYIERTLLLVFGIGVLLRPIFLIPFLWILILIIAQFQYPFGAGTKYSIDYLLVQLLIVIFAWYIVFVLTGYSKINGLLVLVCILLASQYFVSGYVKWKIGWLQDNQIGLFASAAYARGWLSGFSPESVGGLVNLALKVNMSLKVLTLIAELGGLFVLFRRKCLGALLILWTGFHLSIFLLSGYLFWEWIVVEILLWVCFFQKKSNSYNDIFNKGNALLGFALVFGASSWARSPQLTWFDTGVDYAYKLEAVLENGETRELPPTLFSPYRHIFSFSMFEYLSESPQLAYSYGSTGQRERALILYAAKSAEDILAMEKSLPATEIDEERTEKFEDFITRFFLNLPNRLTEKRILSSLQALPTFWTSAIDYPMSDLSELRSVNVVRKTSYFDGLRTTIIDSKPILTVDLPDRRDQQ